VNHSDLELMTIVQEHGARIESALDKAIQNERVPTLKEQNLLVAQYWLFEFLKDSKSYFDLVEKETMRKVAKKYFEYDDAIKYIALEFDNE